MRQLRSEGWSLTQLCETFWGYKNGQVSNFVWQAVERQPDTHSAGDRGGASLLAHYSSPGDAHTGTVESAAYAH